MSLFSRKKRIGEMSISFASREEASVADALPDFIEERLPAHNWFAFHYAAKLFANHPPSVGCGIAEAARDRVNEMAERDGGERSMLGICGSQITIVTAPVEPNWAYSGSFFMKGDLLGVDTKIASGNEEYFHRASVEIAFEVARRRLSDDGLLFNTASGFFDLLSKSEISNLRSNYGIARQLSIMSDPDVLADWLGRHR